MPTKKRLTIDEHKQIAAQLFQIREQLIHISVMVLNAYPHKRKFVSLPGKAMNMIDQLRSDLEDEMFEDFPNQADVYIYYPGSQERPRPTE